MPTKQQGCQQHKIHSGCKDQVYLKFNAIYVLHKLADYVKTDIAWVRLHY